MHKRLKYMLVLSFLGLGQFSFGQYQDKLALEPENIPFKVFVSENGQYAIQDVLNASLPFKSSVDIEKKTDPKDWYWIRLDFANRAKHVKLDSTLYLKFNSFDHGSIFYHQGDSIINRKIGLFDDGRISKKMENSNYFSFIEFTPEYLIDNQYLLLKVRRITFNERITNWRFSIQERHPNEPVAFGHFSQRIPFYFFAGVCFIMWFFSLSLFIIQRTSEFLFYSLYLVIFFLYLTGNHFGIFAYFFKDDYFRQYWFSEGLIFIANSAYCFFLIGYLNTKKDYPIIHRACYAAIALNITMVILMVAFYSWDYTIGLKTLIDYSFMILNLFGMVAAIYLIVIGKNALAYFMAFATVVLCLAGLSRIYLAHPDDGLYLDSLKYMIIGGSVEIVIFTFGLNYKTYQALRENFALREDALLNKIKALRAQINPHFIFNSLSSIQHLVTSDQKVSALKYLSKFSRLTRNILESSMDAHVSLKEEIEMLLDYLELESLRFDNSFSYGINVDENLNPDNVTIPFMIMQPFVENAIIHGLLPKKGNDKKLSVNFKKSDDFMICEVDDNGVGRQMAENNKHYHKKEKISRGLQVTEERLRALENADESLQIIDKFDEADNPAGTKVIFKIPI